MLYFYAVHEVSLKMRVMCYKCFLIQLQNNVQKHVLSYDENPAPSQVQFSVCADVFL